jgi:hypothetical protein
MLVMTELLYKEICFIINYSPVEYTSAFKDMSTLNQLTTMLFFSWYVPVSEQLMRTGKFDKVARVLTYRTFNFIVQPSMSVPADMVIGNKRC